MTYKLELIITPKFRVTIDKCCKVAVFTPRRHEHRDAIDDLIPEEWENIAMQCYLPDNGLS